MVNDEARLTPRRCAVAFSTSLLVRRRDSRLTPTSANVDDLSGSDDDDDAPALSPSVTAETRAVTLSGRAAADDTQGLTLAGGGRGAAVDGGAW